MVLTSILYGLSALGMALLGWQWLAARRFPLHERARTASFHPPVTLLKPLKGCDAHTEACLRSWFEQDYPSPMQLLFAVASEKDPVVPTVQKLLAEFPSADASLVICESLTGTNAKVAKLAWIESMAKYSTLVISDADVSVPRDLLGQVVLPLEGEDVGLVNCFYRLCDSRNLAMRWEAVAANADFWAQVLQSNSLKPMDFALGAVMAVKKAALQQIGGFTALRDCLADDYQLGNRIAGLGYRIELCPVLVDCRHGQTGWAGAWAHQLRWARTIRVCQPVPYFFSILSNPGLWPVLLIAASPDRNALTFSIGCALLRMFIGLDLQRRLLCKWIFADAPVLLLKDLLHVAIWIMAFAGNTVEWRGRKMLLHRDGTVVHIIRQCHNRDVR